MSDKSQESIPPVVEVKQKSKQTSQQPQIKRRIPGEDDTGLGARAYFGCKFEESCPGRKKSPFYFNSNT